MSCIASGLNSRGLEETRAITPHTSPLTGMGRASSVWSAPAVTVGRAVLTALPSCEPSMGRTLTCSASSADSPRWAISKSLSPPSSAW